MRYIDTDIHYRTFFIYWSIQEGEEGLLHACISSFTIGCFANGVQTKRLRFYLKFYQLDSLGVDAFWFEVVHEICWLAPPISLVGRAVQQVVALHCLPVLAVPV